MGRIKQTYLKRTGNNLLKEYSEDFNRDFGNNKEKVTQYSTVTSKSVRNKIAGYITRKNNYKAKELAKEEAAKKAAEESATSPGTTAQSTISQ